MKVRIVQLLCPQRHCAAAVAYQSEDGVENPEFTESLQKTFAHAVEAKVFNPWCHICGSRDLFPEDSLTRFRTLAEAEPHLRALEKAQRSTAAFLKGSQN